MFVCLFARSFVRLFVCLMLFVCLLITDYNCQLPFAKRLPFGRFSCTGQLVIETDWYMVIETDWYMVIETDWYMVIETDWYMVIETDWYMVIETDWYMVIETDCLLLLSDYQSRAYSRRLILTYSCHLRRSHRHHHHHHYHHQRHMYPVVHVTMGDQSMSLYTFLDILRDNSQRRYHTFCMSPPPKHRRHHLHRCQ